jgi:hypothetical protein
MIRIRRILAAPGTLAGALLAFTAATPAAADSLCPLAGGALVIPTSDGRFPAPAAGPVSGRVRGEGDHDHDC